MANIDSEKYGEVLNSINLNLTMQSSFLESMYNIAVDNDQKTTSLLGKILKVAEGERDAMLENIEDEERRRLLSDQPAPSDSPRDESDESDKEEDKKEKYSLGSIGKIAAVIGGALLASPFLLGFVEGFFGKKIGELIDGIKEKALEFLSDPKVLLGIGALVGALGLLLRPISTLITGFKLLRGMLKLGGKAITGLGKMLSKLNLGKMFKNAFKGFGDFFKGSLGKITDMFKGSVGKISTLGASVADSVKKAGKGFADRLKSMKTAGGKGLLGGLLGALAGTSAATSTTTTPNRTPVTDFSDDARARATQNAVDDLKTTPKAKTSVPDSTDDARARATQNAVGEIDTTTPKAKTSVPDSTDDARARATQNAVGEIDTTTPKAKTSVPDPDKVPDVQTDVGKTRTPVVPDSPDVPKPPTTDVSPNRAKTSPIPGQVTTDGLPTVSDASRVPPIDEAKAAKSFLKSSAKYGVKLVPVVGAIAGTLFAAGRLIQGDHVGAAMEAGGVLAPSFTGGATIDIAILARDMYKAYYGTNPETDDPELVKQRMILLKEYVERKMSSVGAAKISQEDQYMSSAAAKITPGMAIGLGGVTTSTEPKGGYQSSTAMALSQTEINRIREIQGLPPTPKIVPPTSKDTNLGKKVDQMSSESSAMQSQAAPVFVKGGDSMMKGGDVIKGGDTTIINNTVIESQNFRNHIPT
jgi:hypothetical protein